MPALPSASRRLKLLLEYSGTRYHGWQVQPNVVTIQGTLEACLARLTNGPVRLHAAGRTDAGCMPSARSSILILPQPLPYRRWCAVPIVCFPVILWCDRQET
jgi:tRNA pseudouridine38-40 synthase